MVLGADTGYERKMNGLGGYESVDKQQEAHYDLVLLVQERAPFDPLAYQRPQGVEFP